MRYFLRIIILTAIAFTLLVSCTTGLFEVVPSDPADDFVGKYRFVESSYIIAGSSYYPSNESGYFTIDKVSSNVVRINDLWLTTGTISGNTLRINDHTEYFAGGYINFYFSPAYLINGQMTITYTSYGYYGSGLKQTTTHGSGTVTATKLNY